MKTVKKVTKAYDRRQKSYQATMNRLNDKQRRGYRKPGSNNPRKNGA